MLFTDEELEHAFATCETVLDCRHMLYTLETKLISSKEYIERSRSNYCELLRMQARHWGHILDTKPLNKMEYEEIHDKMDKLSHEVWKYASNGKIENLHRIFGLRMNELLHNKWGILA